MNISRPSICRWSKRIAATGLVAAAFLALMCGPGAPAQPGKPSPAPRALPPFLQDFRADTEPPVVTREVAFASAVGPVRGYLARPDTREPLPAVLVIHDEAGLTDWIKQSARELASIGYVVLAVDLAKRVPPGGKSAGPAAALADERTLAELSAAVRWLRRQAHVLPERLGVVGWSWGADQALALAAATPMQACVVCRGSLAAEPSLLAGLRGTALLVLVAGKDPTLAAFRKALTAAPIKHKVRVFAGVAHGFMKAGPEQAHAHEQGEAAWVEIYNFLGKYVEDAAENGPVFPSALKVEPRASPVASIADLMRALNNPVGVRMALVRALENAPASKQAWATVRANAALLAEGGRLLEERRPHKGTLGHWREQARAFAALAREVATAADRQDYSAARRALDELGTRCTACHRQHR
jgi:carboxymethylenebutenolidase